MDAVYEGNGLWFVSMDDVSEDDRNVYVGGEVYGTYGKEVYTDGSDEQTVAYPLINSSDAFIDGYTPYGEIYNSGANTYFYGVYPDSTGKVYFKLPEGANSIVKISSVSSYGFGFYNISSQTRKVYLYADGELVFNTGIGYKNGVFQYSYPYNFLPSRASEVYVLATNTSDRPVTDVIVGALSLKGRASFAVTYSYLPSYPEDSATI